jgi:uncharacterized coiled-coil protein SlyX
MYTTATEAQEHAQRYLKRKQEQSKRFADLEYRAAVQERYADQLAVVSAQQEKKNRVFKEGEDDREQMIQDIEASFSEKDDG